MASLWKHIERLGPSAERRRRRWAGLRPAISEYRAANERYVPYFFGLLAAIQLRYEESAEGLDTVVSAARIDWRNWIATSGHQSSSGSKASC